MINGGSVAVKRVFSVILLILSVLLLPACGAAATAPTAATEAPTAAPQATTISAASEYAVEVPKAFRGKWFSMIDPDQWVLFDESSITTPDGTKISLTYAAKKQVSFKIGDIKGMCSLEKGYLQGKRLLPLSERCRNDWFYREGEENPMDRFKGTWILTEGEGSRLKNTPIESYTVTDDLTLLVNGESFPLQCEPVLTEKSPKTTEWLLNSSDGRIHVSISEEYNGAGGISTGGSGWGVYYQDVKTLELTTENWQDFFVVQTGYAMEADEEGVFRSETYVLLLPREGVCIRSISDGRITGRVIAEDGETLHRELEGGSVTLDEMTPAERADFSMLFSMWKVTPVDSELYNLAWFGLPKDVLDVTEGADGAPWGTILTSFVDSTVKQNGSVLSGTVLTDLHFEISSISGTIYLGE